MQDFGLRRPIVRIIALSALFGCGGDRLGVEEIAPHQKGIANPSSTTNRR